MLIIKIGGGAAVNWEYIAKDLAAIIKTKDVVLVHGASIRRDEIAKQLGHPTRTVISPSGVSSVYTDEKALEIFLMSYAGLVNKQIVAQLQNNGVNAVGLCGVDGRIWKGKRKKDLIVTQKGKHKLLRNNLTGRVEKINTNLIELLIKAKYTPVICPPAISYKGEIINTDNDWAIAVMAEALGVTELVVLFESPGLLKDYRDKNSLIKTIPGDKLETYFQYANGRMKKKMLGAQKALAGSVKRIFWGDARIKKPITQALNGKGTIIE